MRAKRIAFQGEPGANSHLACARPIRITRRCPAPTFEDAFAAIGSGEADLGMIPIENSLAGRVADIHHLMPDSGLHIVGRAFPAGAPSADGAIKGATAGGHQDRGEPRPRARPVPQDHPQARHQAGGGRRHRGLGARGRGGRRHDPRRHRVAARRRDLRRSTSSPRTSRTKPTTPRASSCCRARRNGRTPAAGRSSPPSCSGCATCRPRSTRRWAASPPTAST